MSKSRVEFNKSNGKSKLIDDDINPEIIEAVRTIIEGIGENPDREGLLDTPKRVAKSYNELLGGYQKDLVTIVNGAMFDVEYGQGEMIIVENIKYASMCEHHMLPFSGKAHIAYIPSNKVIGLSKIPRIVDMYARRLQVQERLTNEIANALDSILYAEGIMVVVEGQHMCASLRGVKKETVNMKTTALRGKFKDDRQLREEFYSLTK